MSVMCRCAAFLPCKIPVQQRNDIDIVVKSYRIEVQISLIFYIMFAKLFQQIYNLFYFILQISLLCILKTYILFK